MINDPESYAGGSIATGRASHATMIAVHDPDKKGIPWSSKLGGLVWDFQPHTIKICSVE